MIIFPASLVLSATPSLKHTRIGYQTFIRDLAASAVGVSGETANGPADAPMRPDTWEYWEADALPATWTVDFGALQTIDYVGVIGNIGSSGATLLVETTDGTLGGSPSEEVYTTFASSLAPNDDAPIMLLDDARSVSKVRLTLTGTTVPRVSVVYAGVALAMQEPIRGGGHTPLNIARETVLNQSLSRGGQFLGQDYRRMGVNGKLAFELLTPAWVRQYFEPFAKAARKYPYFVGWRPEQYPLEVGFVWSQQDIRPVYMGEMDYMQAAWSVSGIGNE